MENEPEGRIDNDKWTGSRRRNYIWWAEIDEEKKDLRNHWINETEAGGVKEREI